MFAAPRWWAVAEEVGIIPSHGPVHSIYEKTQQEGYYKKFSHLLTAGLLLEQAEEDRRKQVCVGSFKGPGQ
jgi:hypothetical protein